jgi:hypothetical protein
MSELILQKKAKQLCRSEGKAWSLRDFVNGVPGVTMLTVVADEKKRRAYDVGGAILGTGHEVYRDLWRWRHR